MTSSPVQNDVLTLCNLGVNRYIVKPVNFERFTEAVGSIGLYWLLLNQQPQLDD